MLKPHVNLYSLISQCLHRLLWTVGNPQVSVSWRCFLYYLPPLSLSSWQVCMLDLQVCPDNQCLIGGIATKRNSHARGKQLMLQYWGRILERVKILIFEIIVVFTIISNIKILSLRLSVSAISEIFKMRLSVTLLLKLRQLPTCRDFYDELYQPILQHVQWHLYACDVILYAKLTCGMFSIV